jgi:hypothetical protein
LYSRHKKRKLRGILAVSAWTSPSVLAAASSGALFNEGLELGGAMLAASGSTAVLSFTAYGIFMILRANKRISQLDNLEKDSAGLGDSLHFAGIAPVLTTNGSPSGALLRFTF